VKTPFALPVPLLREIPAGFDAIFQFRSDLLGQFLYRSVVASAGQLQTFVDYDWTGLPERVKDEIIQRILSALGLEGGTTLGGTEGTAAINIRLSPGPGGSTGTLILPDLLNPGVNLEEFLRALPSLSLVISAHSPAILFDLGQPRSPAIRDLGELAPGRVVVRWRINVDILFPDPHAISALGLTPKGPGQLEVGLAGNGEITIPTTPAGPPPSPPHKRIVLTYGEALTTAQLDLTVRTTKYQAQAWLDFSDTPTKVHKRNDELFGDLLSHDDQLLTGIQAAFAPLISNPEANITPRIALGGVLRSGEELPGINNFRASLKATQGNDSRSVLSICINVGPAEGEGDPDLVRPFLADQNFAYYVSELIIRGVIFSRWKRLSSALKTTETDVEVPLTDDDGNEDTGLARVSFSFKQLSEVLVGFVPGGLVDVLELRGDHEIKLVALNYKGKDVSNEDAIKPLKNPHVLDFVMHIYPFGGRDIPTAPGTGFLQTIGTHLLEALYRPTTDASIQLQVWGHASSALHAMFIRGEVSFLT
jgi:hypothetical protein